MRAEAPSSREVEYVNSLEAAAGGSVNEKIVEFHIVRIER